MNVVKCWKDFYPKIAPSRGHVLVGGKNILANFEDWLISFFSKNFFVCQNRQKNFLIKDFTPPF